MSYREKTFSAVRWTSFAAATRALLQLLQIVVLARLLMPEDYGLMAMVSVVLGYANMFSDMGVNAAYVQRNDVTAEQRSSLFWLNVGVSCLLSLLIVLMSPLLASFFKDDRLVSLFILASTTIVLSALGQQLRMNAQKELMFKPVVLLELSSIALGFLVAVITAISGFGVYALIFGAITTSLMTTLLSWSFLSQGWRPIYRFKLSDVSSYIGFGSALMISNIVNEVNRNVDVVLGGRMLAATELGLYSLPRQIVFRIQGLVNPVVTRVGFPVIAKHQTDIPKVRSIYLKTLNMTCSANAPLYLGVAFFAPEIVTIVFGDKWIDSVDILRILSVWGLFRATGNPVGSLLLGMGRADLSLKWNLSLLLIFPSVLYAGSMFGVFGLASSLLLMAVVLFVPGWFILVRPLCHAGLWEYCNATFRPALLALFSISFAYFVVAPLDNYIWRVLVAVSVSGALYIAMSFWANRVWFDSMRQLLLNK